MQAGIVDEILIHLPRLREKIQFPQQVPLLQPGIEDQLVARVGVDQPLQQLVRLFQVTVEALPLEIECGFIQRQRRVFTLPVFRGVHETDEDALGPGHVSALRQVARLHQVGILRRRRGAVLPAQLVEQRHALGVAVEREQRLGLQQLRRARDVGAQRRIQPGARLQQGQQLVRLPQGRSGLAVVKGQLGPQPHQPDAQFLRHALRAVGQQSFHPRIGRSGLAPHLHLLDQIPFRLPAAHGVKARRRRRLVQLFGGGLELIRADVGQHPLEDQRARRHDGRHFVQGGGVGRGGIFVIFRTEESLGQQHPEFRPLAAFGEVGPQLHDEVRRRPIPFQVPSHRQPHPQRLSLERRTGVEFEERPRILLRGGVVFVQQRGLGPGQFEVLDDGVLSGRADEVTQIPAQLLPLGRGFRAPRQQLQGEPLGLRSLAVAEQLPEGGAAGHAAFAGDQSEHQAELVGGITLRRGQHGQLALEHSLGLRRAAEPGQGGGIGAHVSVAGALTLKTLHVAAQGRKLRLVHLPRAQP